MRWLALVSALLLSVVSTAQAAHLHRPARQDHHLQAPATTGTQNADTEEHCPLCVAMHPALPAPMQGAPAPHAADERIPSDAREKLVRTGWHFALRSRPPPASL